MKLFMICIVPLLIFNVKLAHAASSSYEPVVDCADVEALPLIEAKAQGIAEETCKESYVDLMISMTAIHTEGAGSTHYFIRFQCGNSKESITAILTSTPQNECSKISYKILDSISAAPSDERPS
ncbi:MAG: hypothetical protein K2Q26_15910 [Bdellovibrionales bacterium]|nr:hypothetical protein [Bdellovibrionales bacterium]